MEIGLLADRSVGGGGGWYGVVRAAVGNPGGHPDCGSGADCPKSAGSGGVPGDSDAGVPGEVPDCNAAPSVDSLAPLGESGVARHIGDPEDDLGVPGDDLGVPGD